MAERRMLSSKIICSDAFTGMPFSAQALYIQLVIEADDDGFLNNARRIQRMLGASEDDMTELLEKRFLLEFKGGIVVIKHWRIHNQIRKDRYTPTQYQDEFNSLDIRQDGAYTEKEKNDTGNHLATAWQPDDTEAATQIRLGEDRVEVGKDKSVKETSLTLFQKLAPDYILDMPNHEELYAKTEEWIKYKMERKEKYTEIGLKALLRKIENNALKHGDRAVCDLIDESMANGWMGIIFDRLKQKQATSSKTSGGVDFRGMWDNERGGRG